MRRGRDLMAYLLHDLLRKAAEASPDSEAVRCRGRTLTYGELERSSDALARTLLASGVLPGDRVGIHLGKRVEMVGAVYGILKAGAAYVPLDPAAPVPRVALVADDCRISALVTTPARAHPLVSSMSTPPRLVLLVDDGPGGAEAAPDADLPCPAIGYDQAVAPSAEAAGGPASLPEAIDQDLAYILYTSGSTGVPKGVMLTHRNALTFVEWCAEAIGIGPGDRLSNHAPLHFDLSVFDLFLAAMGGAAVVPVPEEEAYLGPSLARFIRDEGITVWYSVPSALMLLTRASSPGDEFPSMRAVVFAGEVYPTRHLRELRELIPGADLWNLYGPTETNVCTYHKVEELPEDDRTIPIGRACGNSEVFALTDSGTRAGVGEEGELHVRGSTVMKGYWGRLERTAEVLFPNPLAPELPDLVYRTGDLVRLRPDGGYDFLGRRDHQIKSRGYRIELGDIEAALSAHPDLLEAVAVPVPHPEWGTSVVAFVVPRDGLSPTEPQVKRHVADRLPRYMVPAKVEILDSLPRTPNGKVDRQQLLRNAGGG